MNEGARAAQRGFISTHDNRNASAVRTTPVVVSRAPVVIDRSGGRPCGAVTASMPDPGAARAHCNALVPAAFAAVYTVFDAVQRSVIIAFIAAAFPPVPIIFDKVRASPWIETPFASIGGLARTDAPGPEHSHTGNENMVDTHTALSFLEKVAAIDLIGRSPHDAAPDANHETLNPGKIRRRRRRKFFRRKTRRNALEGDGVFLEGRDMKTIKAAAFLILSLAVTACASGRGGPKNAAGPAPGLQQPGKLLALARDTQAKKGCTAALPAYRVISSFGDGYEIAQYELGACLLETSGASDAETALLREEAALWLRRAAWAGNARAQLRLAQLLSGAPGTGLGVASAPEEALGWSVVYNENAQRDLFDLPAVPDAVAAHLNAALDTASRERALAFAESFTPVTMSAFTPPRAGRNDGSQQQTQGPPREGRRRRR